MWVGIDSQFLGVTFLGLLLWLEQKLQNPFDVPHVEQRDLPPVDPGHGAFNLPTVSAWLLIEEWSEWIAFTFACFFIVNIV